MGNTTFYRQAKQDISQITWKDIFSEYKVKHTKEDLEYALMAGTSLDRATEQNMLAKWKKPWIFYPALKLGLALLAILYGVFFFNLLTAQIPALVYMTVIVPPLIPPLILCIFFWEMNIPRNISLYQMMGIFVVGGILSIFVTGIMILFVPQGPSYLAPLSEEPGKLIVAAVFLSLFSKKHKVYGLTGLVIGAAVGAGFGAFESMSYAINIGLSGGLGAAIRNQLLRGVLSLGGHTLFCAPYAAELALHVEQDGRLSTKSFTNADFLSAFLISCFFHFAWNMEVGGLIKCVIITALLWVQLLRIMRKCLYQIISAAHYQSGDDAAYQAERRGAGRAAWAGEPAPYQAERRGGVIAAQARSIPYIQVQGVSANRGGTEWKSDRGGSLIVGRATDCGIRFPSDAKGVSRSHLSIQLTNYGWTVKDLNSSYGTYVGNGVKLLPGTEWQLHSGDKVYLGSKDNYLNVTII
ncbi:MAG: FHA domain-containing protein [Lachnospiraceae bacterium]|nr:FHA domain-containing protein [Lachnospiraceae bacterium]